MGEVASYIKKKRRRKGGHTDESCKFRRKGRAKTKKWRGTTGKQCNIKRAQESEIIRDWIQEGSTVTHIMKTITGDEGAQLSLVGGASQITEVKRGGDSTTK